MNQPLESTRLEKNDNDAAFHIDVAEWIGTTERIARNSGRRPNNMATWCQIAAQWIVLLEFQDIIGGNGQEDSSHHDARYIIGFLTDREVDNSSRDAGTNVDVSDGWSALSLLRTHLPKVKYHMETGPLGDLVMEVRDPGRGLLWEELSSFDALRITRRPRSAGGVLIRNTDLDDGSFDKFSHPSRVSRLIKQTLLLARLRMALRIDPGMFAAVLRSWAPEVGYDREAGVANSFRDEHRGE